VYIEEPGPFYNLRRIEPSSTLFILAEDFSQQMK